MAWFKSPTEQETQKRQNESGGKPCSCDGTDSTRGGYGVGGCGAITHTCCSKCSCTGIKNK